MAETLTDPVQIAAYQMLRAWFFAPVQDETLIRAVQLHDDHANALIEESARQIDALRAAGVIPEKTNDPT